MRYSAVLIAVMCFATCRAQTPDNESQARSSGQNPAREMRKESRDSVVQFLVASCANDFHAHRPPDPVRFRDVRIGHYLSKDGTTLYMLCGQFLPAQGGDKAVWTAFATIQTSGYEQYLGPQAASFCQNSTVTMDTLGDLSSSLQDRYESLR